MLSIYTFFSVIFFIFNVIHSLGMIVKQSKDNNNNKKTQHNPLLLYSHVYIYADGSKKNCIFLAICPANFIYIIHSIWSTVNQKNIKTKNTQTFSVCHSVIQKKRRFVRSFVLWSIFLFIFGITLLKLFVLFLVLAIHEKYYIIYGTLKKCERYHMDISFVLNESYKYIYSFVHLWPYLWYYILY